MNKIDEYQLRYSTESVKEYVVEALREAAIDFQTIILEAHQMTMAEARLKPPHYIHKVWLPDTMYGNIIGKFKDYHGTLMTVDSHGRPYLRISHDIRVYFKKLDKSYKPNNVTTENVEAMWNQDIDKIHVLFIGYRINKQDWTTIKGVYGSYPSSFFKRKIDWVIDMSEFSSKIKLAIQAPAPAEIQITQKKKSEKEGKTG